MTGRHRALTFAASGLACVLHGCLRPGSGASGASQPLTDTSVETRAVGCYRLLTPVREVGPEFALLARHGQGTGPEALGRLIRPRGGYKSAHWSRASQDTLELVWTSTPSDSTTTGPVVAVYMDALRARVTVTGDTLRGRAVWGSDVADGSGPRYPSYDFRAVRTVCAESGAR